MHAAPPLRVGLARSRGWIVFVGACAGCAAANLIGWSLLHRPAGAAATLLAALAVPASAVLSAAWAWRSQAPLVLRWDGATWLCDDMPGDAEVVLDLNGWMLLRFVAVNAGSRGRWIAASRAATDGPWAALRSALYSRRPATAPHAPSP